MGCVTESGRNPFAGDGAGATGAAVVGERWSGTMAAGNVGTRSKSDDAAAPERVDFIFHGIKAAS